MLAGLGTCIDVLGPSLRLQNLGECGFHGLAQGCAGAVRVVLNLLRARREGAGWRAHRRDLRSHRRDYRRTRNRRRAAHAIHSLPCIVPLHWRLGSIGIIRHNDHLLLATDSTHSLLGKLGLSGIGQLIGDQCFMRMIHGD